MAMKLRGAIQKLTEDPELKDISLIAASDVDLEIDSFLVCLRKSRIQKVIVWTDFLSCLEEDKMLEFLQLLQHLSHLQELIFKSSSRFHVEIIPGEGLLSIREISCLKRLVFEDMQVTALQTGFIQSLSDALENHTSVQEVVLSNFFSNDWANTEDNTLDPLFLAMSTIPNLERLTFTGCGGCALNCQQVSLVSTRALAAVFQNASIKELQLSFLELDDPQFETIAMEVAKNTSINSLALDYHNLAEYGFCKLMAAMETNRHVKNLSLRSLWNIGRRGFEEAMKMLRHNYWIESLSVTASPSQQAEIDLYSRMNTAGRSLLREPGTSMSQWLDVLAANSDDIDVVRSLLKEIPDLCKVATQS
ncbi:unnamed protein product [Cylindrotheca closterium]|uniref:Uncharacterized protein n=1 Tax=Cylindrotheca closterium TaxID=2856 RepID=A0AAD2FWA6_9STRA|nr:unnamed protein product [Cylindrotheca closterium]